MAVSEATHSCPQCPYTAKTKGAITMHVKKAHADDKLAAIRAKYEVSKDLLVNPDNPMVIAPSGIPAFDYAMGVGGVPRGSIIEIFGPAHSGKTAMALTFSAHAQQQGQKAGYMDTEEALTPQFVDLFGDLNGQALEYQIPPGDGSGESALQMSRDFINTGEFAVWTVDSVHGLTPRSMVSREIGDPNTSASLAQLCSEACKIMKHELRETGTLAVFVNHMKSNPRASYGRDWSKPGGSAFDYYATVQLHVTPGKPYYRKGDGARIGHPLKIRIHKSKVSMPFGSTEFDLFYGTGETKPDKENNTPSRKVEKTGIDLASSYLSVLKESGHIRQMNGAFFDTDGGEQIGKYQETLDALSDPNTELRQRADNLIYRP